MFLNEQQERLLTEMALLRPSSYVNSNGNKVSGKMWPLGLNWGQLIGVRLQDTKNGNKCIVCEFKRKPMDVIGYKTKITFAPHQEYIFDYDKAAEICHGYNYELKSKPDDMDLNTYLTHVARRIATFRGAWVQMVVEYKLEPRMDEYGFQEERNVYYNLKEKVFDWRMECMFYNINDQIDLDWWKLSRIFAKQIEEQ